jgi:putative copper export protein
VAARLLALLGPVALLGLAVLRFGVVEPARRAGGIAPPGEPAAARAAAAERAGAALEAASPRWWAAWWAGAAAGAAGLVLLPAALLRALREGPGELGTLLGDTRFGTAWWIQAGALLAAAVAGASLRRREGAWSEAPPWAPALGLGAPPAVALIAIAWAGHASTGPDRLANIAIDALHGLATAAWLGGLAGLLALLPAAACRLADPERVRVCAGVVVRFSSLAIAAVSVLVVTGVYRALAELGSLADLTGTAYGRALLVKLGLFAVLLAGGAYNRLVVHPRLEGAALGLADSDRGAGAALRVSVAAELVLALAVMTSVAVLVSLAPPAG